MSSALAAASQQHRRRGDVRLHHAGRGHAGTVDAFVRAALRADPIYADWRDEQQFNGFAARRSWRRRCSCTATAIRTPVLIESKLFTRFGTPDKAWVVLPGADHAAHLEKALPELVRAIVWFVRRHEIASPSTESP